MSDGRVVNREPESLKKICFFSALRDEQQKEINRDAEGRAERSSENLRKMLNNSAANGEHKYNGYRILSSDESMDRVAFAKEEKGKGIVPHVDGILQDVATGELRYFVAIEGEFGDNTIEDIEEGCLVSYSNQDEGCCEIILHKRGEQNNILGDIELEEKPVVVPFVMITGISSRIKGDKNKRIFVIKNVAVNLYDEEPKSKA